MSTKEEILATKNWSSEYPNFMAESEIQDAMDEFSAQQSIAFAEWILNNNYFHNGIGSLGHWLRPINREQIFTTEQLFNLFMEQQNK
jgi:hypothetical protein